MLHLRDTGVLPRVPVRGPAPCYNPRPMFHPQQSANAYAEVLNDEVCVYDRERLAVHALNPTLARVWHMCDGQTSPAEMAGRLRAELTPRMTAGQAEALVWSSLTELHHAHLLQGE